MSLLSAARRIKHAGHLRVTDARTVLDAASRRRDQREVRRRVAEAMDLPPLPRVRGIWAVAMVRDEADVLERSLRRLAEEGADRILVVDNGSTDGTRDLLADLARELPLLVGADRLVAYEQSAKMTHLADAAARAGATWVLPFDADELWCGTDGTIADVLRRARTPMVGADMVNAFPDPDVPGRWRLDPTPQRDPKVAFRPFPGAIVEMGNHGVARPGRTGEGLGIVHLPWRSLTQFSRKTRQGAQALALTSLEARYGTHWRTLGALDDAGLADRWERLLRGEADASTAWYPQAATVPFDPDAAALWDAVRAARR